MKIVTLVATAAFAASFIATESAAAAGVRDPAVRPPAQLGPSTQNPTGPGSTTPVSGSGVVIDLEDLGLLPGGTIDPPDFACITSGGLDFCPGPANTFNDLHVSNTLSGHASNGTTVLLTHNDVIVKRTDGMPFSLTQFDFAGFPTNNEVPFQVMVQPGGAVAMFTPDGVVNGPTAPDDFQTFVLPGSFVGTSFEFLSSGTGSLDAIFAIDNLCVGPPCSIIYGVGCPGSGGIVPTLTNTVCDAQTGQVAFAIENGLGGSSAVLLFGLTQAAVPIGSSGCFLNLGTVLPLSFTLPLGGAGPGNGSLLLPGTFPPSASGLTFTMQTAVGDPQAALGFSMSAGIEMTAP